MEQQKVQSAQAQQYPLLCKVHFNMFADSLPSIYATMVHEPTKAVLLIPQRDKTYFAKEYRPIDLLVLHYLQQVFTHGETTTLSAVKKRHRALRGTDLEKDLEEMTAHEEFHGVKAKQPLHMVLNRLVYDGIAEMHKRILWLSPTIKEGRSYAHIRVFDLGNGMMAANPVQQPKITIRVR